jgi:hypothetical protein
LWRSPKRADSPRLYAGVRDGPAGQPDIETVWPTARLLGESLALLQARPDKTYSLCDAVSFVLMRRRNLSEALTTDRHFEQEGFRRLLA